MSQTTATPNCRIFLRRLRLFCKIGIDPAECETAQHLLLDVEITPANDGKPDTPVVDYATVMRRMEQFAAEKQHALLETFAREAAEIIAAEFDVAHVRVTCRKPRPFSQLEEAGAEVSLTPR